LSLRRTAQRLGTAGLLTCQDDLGLVITAGGPFSASCQPIVHFMIFPIWIREKTVRYHRAPPKHPIAKAVSRSIINVLARMNGLNLLNCFF